MRSVATAALVASHRFFLLSGTVVLAVGTSRLADHSDQPRNWCLSATGGFLMVLGDVLLEIDRVGTDLSRSSGQALRKSRADIFMARRPLVVLALVVAIAASVIAAFVV